MACCPDLNPTRRVQLQSPKDDATADAAGHIDWSLDANWNTEGTVWCEIKTRGGSENWRFNQLESTVSRIFRLRSTKQTRAVDSRYRLRTKNDDGGWDVHGVAMAFDVDGARRVVEVHATEAV